MQISGWSRVRFSVRFPVFVLPVVLSKEKLCRKITFDLLNINISYLLRGHSLKRIFRLVVILPIMAKSVEFYIKEKISWITSYFVGAICMIWKVVPYVLQCIWLFVYVFSADKMKVHQSTLLLEIKIRTNSFICNIQTSWNNLVPFSQLFRDFSKLFILKLLQFKLSSNKLKPNLNDALSAAACYWLGINRVLFSKVCFF